MGEDYVSVTEMAGDKVSAEQIARLCNRYYWAGNYCECKDVVEVACGSGQGLGLLDEKSKTFEAGDYSTEIIEICKQHYKNRIPLCQFDAQKMPYDDASKDIIILFEAIYYIEDVNEFINECKRILRPGGKVLIATANKDLYDFNPSPYSYNYYGSKELNEIFTKNGFIVNCYGDTPVNSVSLRQKILRPIKMVASKFNVIPGTTVGKKILKRIVFGDLLEMPREINDQTARYIEAKEIPVDKPDKTHKVIFCEATIDLKENLTAI